MLKINLDSNSNKSSPEFISTDKLKCFINLLKKEKKQTIIFSGGDPLWFGIGRLLIQNFSLSELHFEPAPTSFQLAFSRLGKPWQDTQWISIHGREHPILIREKLMTFVALSERTNLDKKEQ